ncbi:hypothetical protein IQ07DRAFT_107229 [Pyrenochaeta sp. DS3sAY3a]|nr:hypothetical protein IQ07DRAFT_107229 [Pyrenochaeta sp. DS3sAY3a]
MLAAQYAARLQRAGGDRTINKARAAHASDGVALRLADVCLVTLLTRPLIGCPAPSRALTCTSIHWEAATKLYRAVITPPVKLSTNTMGMRLISQASIGTALETASRPRSQLSPTSILHAALDTRRRRTTRTSHPRPGPHNVAPATHPRTTNPWWRRAKLNLPIGRACLFATLATPQPLVYIHCNIPPLTASPSSTNPAVIVVSLLVRIAAHQKHPSPVTLPRALFLHRCNPCHGTGTAAISIDYTGTFLKTTSHLPGLIPL